ncbi:MAG: YraN family protein [Bacillota bacterium]|nr:YraN family protein [Bacillota bacterium]
MKSRPEIRRDGGLSARLGAAAEEAAARLLLSQGYTLLERNWRRPGLELDLAARSPDGRLVLVEVRGRRLNATVDAGLSLIRRKRLRFLRAARLYAALRGAEEARLDVILLSWTDGACQLRHLRDLGGELLGGGAG